MEKILRRLDDAVESGVSPPPPIEENGYATLREIYEQSQLEPTPMLWEPYLKGRQISAIVGLPDSGKSLLWLQLCLAIARGDTSFLDLPLNTKHRRAIIVSTEDDELEVLSRVQKQTESDEAWDRIFVVPGNGLLPHELLNIVESILVENQVDLIVVDAYGDCVGGDENNNSQARQTVTGFARFVTDYKTHLTYIHHIKKSAGKEAPDPANVQGAGSFVAKLRTVFQLTKDERSEQRFLSVIKGNSIGSADKKNSLVLAFDEPSLTYTNTGDTVDKSSIGSSSTRIAKKGIDWEAIFGSDTLLAKSEIVKRLTQRQIPSTTAYRRISQELEICESTGNFRLPGIAVCAFTGQGGDIPN